MLALTAILLRVRAFRGGSEQMTSPSPELTWIAFPLRASAPADLAPMAERLEDSR